jgi:hypothetical protein
VGAQAVIEQFNVIEDSGFGLLSEPVNCVVCQFVLQIREEAFSTALSQQFPFLLQSTAHCGNTELIRMRMDKNVLHGSSRVKYTAAPAVRRSLTR